MVSSFQNVLYDQLSLLHEMVASKATVLVQCSELYVQLF